MTQKYRPQLRLFTSAVLAFTVMLFINGFIGSMGGFPAFIACMLAFYRARSQASEKLEKSEVLAGHLFFEYAVSYILLWCVFRVGLFFSKVTGWGNIRGLSAIEYIREMMQTSMLEKWTYIFAALAMFAFVFSLFPLVVIKNKLQWICYALVDGACFALISSGIEAFALRGVESVKRKRATCLIDSLLLQGAIKSWQAALYMIIMATFLIAVAAFVISFSRKVLAGRKKEPEPIRIKVELIAAATAGIAAIVVVAIIVLLAPADSTGDYKKVAEYLTGDVTLGPISYRGTVYVPDDTEFNLIETGTAQGYLAESGENCESRLYKIAKANLLYSDTTGLTTRLKAENETVGTYVPVAEIEQLDLWQNDTTFLIWDEDWEAESAYSHDPTGYTTCTADLIEALMVQFPQVNYNITDFYDYDAYFTIRAYTDMDAVTEQNAATGDWVGCILAKDDKFYFGSYDNQITGICLQELHEVLGGN
jgi:hypothetical protein